MLPALPASRRTRLLACAIVAAAAGLRISGISAGAPYRMGVDEPVILEIALRMMRTGDFNPHFYDYGGLTLYLHTAVGAITFLAGAMDRQWASLDQMWIGDLLVGARLVSVVLGTATVWLVYLIGRRFGVATALIAAGAMAVQPQHVRESHFALTDTPLTFFITLTLWLAIRGAETGRLSVYLLAGAAAGAAGATKYHGVLALLMPIATALVLPHAAIAARAVAAALGGAAAGFLLGAPYSVLDLPGFLNGFASLMQHYNARRSTVDSFVTYLKYMRGWFAAPPVVWLEIGWIGVGLCAAGAVLSILMLRDRGLRAAALALVVFPPVFLWFISRQGALQFGRYAMPIAPMLSIFLAIAIGRLRAAWLAAPAPSRARRLAAAALLLVLVPPLGSSIGRNVGDRKLSTVDQAARWLASVVRPGEKVAHGLENVQLPPSVGVEFSTRIADTPVEDFRARGITYVVAVSTHPPGDRAAGGGSLGGYAALARGAQIVHAFPSSTEHPGPTITVLKLP
ncbi:MAG: glycosyltransferase family 39 protein [Acidobacteria bacterium]|nr:glycosyltransferase family 39 protein [Acidobacteriota bacterium]